MKKYLMELIGTFFLASAVILSQGNPLAVGLMFMAMFYWGAALSGSHYNPAVTLALMLKGKVKSDLVPGYMLAQVFGALLASLLFTGDPFCPRLGTGELVTGGIFELLFTFAFCGVIIAVVTHKYKDLGGLIIGLTLAALIFTVPVGVFNPALAAGSMLTSVIKGSMCSMIDYVVYLLAPFAGAFLAYTVCDFLHSK